MGAGWGPAKKSALPCLTANFGAYLRGAISRREMGLPIADLVRAHKPERHFAPLWLTTGGIPQGEVPLPRIRPVDGYQVSSNFERSVVFCLLGQDSGRDQHPDGTTGPRAVLT